jgi:hypothetical protein
VTLLQEELERLLTVARDNSVVALRLEIEAKTIGDVLLVFDDENACHDGLLPTA